MSNKIIGKNITNGENIKISACTKKFKMEWIWVTYPKIYGYQGKSPPAKHQKITEVESIFVSELKRARFWQNHWKIKRKVGTFLETLGE